SSMWLSPDVMSSSGRRTKGILDARLPFHSHSRTEVCVHEVSIRTPTKVVGAVSWFETNVLVEVGQGRIAVVVNCPVHMIDAVLDVVLGRHEVATRETITEETFVISQKYDFTVRWLVFIQVFLRHLVTDFLDCVLVETLLYLRDVLGQEAFRYRSRRYDCRNMTRVCLVQDYYRSHRDDVACRCWRIVLPSEFEILNSSERFVAIEILRCDNVSCLQVASC